MAERYYREESKKNWYTENQITTEHLKTGCLQRIADATEAMSKNYLSLQNSLDYYKKECETQRNSIDTLKRSNAALRGHINRLKK